MTTTTATAPSARDLYRAGDYAAALPHYAARWAAAGATAWEGFYYAQCLGRVGQHAAALDVCRAVYRRFPDFAPIRNAYAWAVYRTELHGDPAADEPRFRRAVRAVVTLTRPDDAYAPRAAAVLRWLRHLKSKANFPADEALRWTNCLAPAHLSARPVTVPDGKYERLVASERERYYAYRTRALFDLGRYADCVAAVDAALDSLGQLHHNHAVWFPRRRALALAALGRADEAITALRALVSRADFWVLRSDLARLLADRGEADAALRAAAAAATAPGDAPLKLPLWRLLADLLRDRDPALAARHAALAAALATEQGWRVDAAALAAHGLGPEALPPSRQLLAELAPAWAALATAGLPRYVGTVLHWLPHGRAGFVRAANGRTHYFARRAWPGREAPAVGTAVTFCLLPGYDARKQREALNATHLQPA